MNKLGFSVSTSLNVGVMYERSKVGLKLWYRTGVKGGLSQSLVVSVCLSLALVDGKLVCGGSRNGLFQLLYSNSG